MKEFLIIYSIVILLMSVIAALAYKSDKNRAMKNKWRIKESVLLGLGALGGSVGALLAMKLFRHKTKHWYFWVVNILSLAIHVAIPIIVCLTLF
ncbi:MAG: DUF1294 domain-containing protein [Clostridiales bacterium]|nr:DUF1294 domain-containing protein [Clostridiales bacterium]